MPSVPRWWWLDPVSPSTPDEVREALSRMWGLLGETWEREVERARDTLVERIRGLPASADAFLVGLLDETMPPARESSLNAMVCSAIVTGIDQRWDRDEVPLPAAVEPRLGQIMLDRAFPFWARKQALEVLLTQEGIREPWARAALGDSDLRSVGVYDIVARGEARPEEVSTFLRDDNRLVRTRAMVGLVARGTRLDLARLVEIALTKGTPAEDDDAIAQEILWHNLRLFVSPRGSC